MAQREGVAFRILSGQFGLVASDDPLPFYDHLLRQEEVEDLSEAVARQLCSQRIEEVVYFTKEPVSHPLIGPYFETIKRACARVGSTLEVHVTDEGEEMSNFRAIMAEAEHCKMEMLRDSSKGEQAFRDLIEKYPGDGMVRLKRAEAYEAVGQLRHAYADYEQAEVLLPMANWKTTARSGAERIRSRLAQQEKQGLSGKGVAIAAGGVLHVIRGLETLLDRIAIEAKPNETLFERIKRLEVPRDVKNHMHYIRNARNEIAHPRNNAVLSDHAAVAFIAAWRAVKEWAQKAGHRIDDLP